MLDKFKEIVEASKKNRNLVRIGWALSSIKDGIETCMEEEIDLVDDYADLVEPLAELHSKLNVLKLPSD